MYIEKRLIFDILCAIDDIGFENPDLVLKEKVQEKLIELIKKEKEGNKNVR